MNNKVLVVDDDEIVCSLLTDMFTRHGYTEVDCANDGQSALLHLRKNSYGLVICDWNMPNGSGLSVTQVTKSSSKNKNAAVVILTAHENDAFRVAAMSSGADEYLIKPLTSFSFSEKIVPLLKE